MLYPTVWKFIFERLDVDSALSLRLVSTELANASNEPKTMINPWSVLARRLGVAWLPQCPLFMRRCCVEVERSVDFVFDALRDDCQFRAVLSGAVYSGDALVRAVASLRGGFVRHYFRRRFEGHRARSDDIVALNAEIRRSLAVIVPAVRSFDELCKRFPHADVDVHGRRKRACRRADALVVAPVSTLRSVSVRAVLSLTPLDEKALAHVAEQLRPVGVAYANGVLSVSTRDGVAAIGVDGVLRVDEAPNEEAAHRAYATLRRLVGNVMSLPPAMSFSISSLCEHGHLTRLQCERLAQRAGRVMACGASLSVCRATSSYRLANLSSLEQLARANKQIERWIVSDAQFTRSRRAST